jgi:leucyl/phenylalanyl-tRNA--protein transferase
MLEPNRLQFLTDDVTWFPPPSSALEDPDGLIALGGSLDEARVYNAYKSGIFPWFSEGEPIMWWLPSQRAVIYPDDLIINKSLKKFLKKSKYSVSVNTHFRSVIEQCAGPRRNGEGTWINQQMINTYHQLHLNGKAHSIEIWQIDSEGKTLIGGLYGVLVGNCFCGESMFSLQPNASKLALLTLGHLIKQNDGFIDSQLPNPYLMSMGAKLISRDLYLQQLSDAVDQSVETNTFKKRFLDWRTFELI